MARIPFVAAGDVPAGERAAYDAFVKQRGKQPDSGPYAMLACFMNTYELEAPA